jgi:hypothetical protein
MNIIALLIIGMGAVVIGILLLKEFTPHRPSLAAKRRGIAHLDLDRVRTKAQQRHGWTETQSKELESEYRDFLILVAENPNDVISPWSNALDQFWHEHILDTRRYDADCARIFGYKIQHDPHIESDPYRHADTVKLTMEKRTTQLRQREERKVRANASRLVASYSDGPDFSVIFGCAADPAPADHSSHGSHSAHSSDPSGHSCGGHGGDGGSHGGGHSCGGGHGCGGGH